MWRRLSRSCSGVRGQSHVPHCNTIGSGDSYLSPSSASSSSPPSVTLRARIDTGIMLTTTSTGAKYHQVICIPYLTSHKSAHILILHTSARSAGALTWLLSSEELLEKSVPRSSGARSSHGAFTMSASEPMEVKDEDKL